MLLIDCETDDSALRTTSAALGVRPQNLVKRLNDLQAVENNDSPWLDPGSQCGLLKTLETDIGRETNFQGVCYFHFTRVLPFENFEQGILPGIDRLPQIWEMLKKHLPIDFHPAEWDAIKRDIENDRSHWAHLYRLKTKKRGMAGPFGQLIHKVVFIPDWNGIHYLATPETVEDICLFFEERHNFDLQEAFINATVPCVVKFRVMDAQRFALDDALHFVYRNTKGDGPHPMMLCHDAGGKPIPYDQIIRVSFLPDIYGPIRLAQKAKRKEIRARDAADNISFL